MVLMKFHLFYISLIAKYSIFVTVHNLFLLSSPGRKGRAFVVPPALVWVWACTKTLTLPITHELLWIELSYFTCAFLVTIPFHGYQNF